MSAETIVGKLAIVIFACVAVTMIACAGGEHTDADSGGTKPGERGRVAAPPATMSPQASGAVAEETVEELYMRLGCPGCHEYAAVPGMIARPLDNLRTRFTEETLAQFLIAPPEGMPNFGLSQEQADALAGFVLLNFG